MTLNIDLLNKALAVIEQRPANWDQGTWISRDSKKVPSAEDEWCGTTCCLAGHVALLSGEYQQGVTYISPDTGSWVSVPLTDPTFRKYAKADGPRSRFYFESVFIDSDGVEINDIEVPVRDLLGLTAQQSNHLFIDTAGQEWESAKEFTDYVRAYLGLADAPS